MKNNVSIIGLAITLALGLMGGYLLGTQRHENERTRRLLDSLTAAEQMLSHYSDEYYRSDAEDGGARISAIAEIAQMEVLLALLEDGNRGNIILNSLQYAIRDGLVSAEELSTISGRLGLLVKSYEDEAVRGAVYEELEALLESNGFPAS